MIKMLTLSTREHGIGRIIMAPGTLPKSAPAGYGAETRIDTNYTPVAEEYGRLL